MRKHHTSEFLKTTIRSPDVKTALDAMAACHRTSGHDPKGMFIVGPSGAGKSTIIRIYVSDRRPVDEVERTRRPVLCGSLAPRTSVRGMLTALLRSTDDPDPASGTVDGMLLRLYELIKRCEIELMVLDEIHHVLPEHTPTKTQHAADLLKVLTDETKVPIVLVGLPESVRLLQAQKRGDIDRDQLRRRFRKLVRIVPPSLGSSGWRDLVHMYQRALAEKARVPCIRLDHPDLLRRLYLATAGLPGRLTNLFAEALELTDGDTQITLEHLARAHEEASSLHDFDGNPFRIKPSDVEKQLSGLGYAK